MTYDDEAVSAMMDSSRNIVWRDEREGETALGEKMEAGVVEEGREKKGRMALIKDRRGIQNPTVRTRILSISTSYISCTEYPSPSLFCTSDRSSKSPALHLPLSLFPLSRYFSTFLA